jgi:guanylate kinase
MRELERPFHFTVTATTRPQRPSEQDGVDYIFVTDQAFRDMLDAGDLLEWAEVYGHMYGVPKSQVVDALRAGRDVLIKADVQGAATIRRLVPEALLIFLAAPSEEELAHRLGQRMTESPEALELRLRTARNEIEKASSFDHIVVNHTGRLDEAVAEIEAIVAHERHKAPERTTLL